MFCPRCGTSVNENTAYCQSCGAQLQSPQSWGGYQQPNQFSEPGRGTTILVLGILSLVCLGLFTGIPAWVMGTTDLRKIRDGIISRSEHSTTQIGMILGIIGTALSVLGILYMIFVAVLVADAMHGYRY